jgi:Ala-tRNA(Pro) deacylase
VSVPRNVQDYLCKAGARYDVYPHSQTENFLHAADECQISVDNVVKGIVMADEDKHHLMALLPAMNKVNVKRLSKLLNRDLQLVSREELSDLFPDCNDYAVPPLGKAYRMDVIWDDELEQMSDIYFDEGDHAGFLHMSGLGFVSLLNNEPHCSFSERMPLIAS